MQTAKVAEICKREGNSIGEYSLDPKRMLNFEVVGPKTPSLIQGYYLWTFQSLASTREKERGSYNTPRLQWDAKFQVVRAKTDYASCSFGQLPVFSF